MASELSDDQLRAQLKAHGVIAGPITTTTRQLWERKLNAVLEADYERKKNPNVSRTLNAFSSDDSEIDATGSSDRNKSHRKKRLSAYRVSPNVQLKKFEMSPGSPSKSSTPVSDVFKKPLAVSQTRVNEKKNSGLSPKAKSPRSFSGRNHVLHTTFDVETSDSDFDSEILLRPMRTLHLRNLVNHSPRLSKNTHEVIKNKKNDSKRNSSVSDLIKAGKIRSLTKKTADPVSSYSGDKLLKDGSFSANGYMTDAILNGDFPSAKRTSQTTNYSYCVSWMLVFGMAAFFLIIGVVYMTGVQKASLSTTRSHLVSLKCSINNVSGCIPDKHFKLALLVSRELHSLLSTIAGEYECQNNRKTRHLSAFITKSLLKEKFINQLNGESFDTVFKYALALVLQNPDWGIRLFNEGEEITAFRDDIAQEISALEATHAAKPFWCRLQHSICWTTAKLVFLSLGLLFVCLIFFCIRFWKKKEEAQEKQFCELVDKIIDILQQPDEYGSPGSDSSCKAVVHIRDMLIPPKERKEKQWLWDKAVAFIEENESRVRVEYQQIAGESHKMWRWLSSPEVESGKHGKVWQGQAFGSLGKGRNSIPYSSTPCLKIRNMFDPEVEYGNDWKISVQDAILEKCEGNNGIIHIAVDTSTNEGCIYMLCNSSEAAGKAFAALHGWWFDGKLVTVKYLRLERYLERFPEAEYCVEPLKPSNNKRLSLSAPFFSSALERS